MATVRKHNCVVLFSMCELVQYCSAVLPLIDVSCLSENLQNRTLHTSQSCELLHDTSCMLQPAAYCHALHTVQSIKGQIAPVPNKVLAAYR
jgi:hypothetical protein